MGPDEVKATLEKAFPRLRAERRTNPSGWSFFLDEVRRGVNSTRIARAVCSSALAPTELKLSVSARTPGKRSLFKAVDPDEVCRLIEAEIDLFTQRNPSSLSTPGEDLTDPPIENLTVDQGDEPQVVATS